MTIEEIESNLPNGLHDAILGRIDIDYIERKARLDIQVSVEDAESQQKHGDGEHRLGQLTLSGLSFCVIEAPDRRYPYQETKGLWIADSGPVKTGDISIKLPGLLSQGAFVHYFFVNDWNAFIYVAAMDAHFEWI
jgi:hypothetical protein